MKNSTRLLDILDRTLSGPIVDEREWDMLMVPKEVARVRAEFDVNLDKLDGAIVPSDDSLADRVFEAGLAMAESLGAYCLSTARRIQFSENELHAILSVAPTEITFGEGLDRHTEHKRRIEDVTRMTIKGGGVGTPVPEDLWIPIHQSYAQEPLVDEVVSCCFERVYGREIRSISPWEVLAGWHEAELSRTAARRAGRPGLALGCVTDSVSALGELSATSFGGFTPNDAHQVAMISEFKTDFMLLSKLAHFVRTGCVTHGFYNPIYGGSVGGKEGMAIAIVAGSVLMQAIYMASTHSVGPAHPFYDNNSTPEIMVAISLAHQGLARNTRLLTDFVITPVGGPGTKTLLYETAAMATMGAASGTCALIGPRSACGVHSAHVSGLESRFAAEVAHSAAGMPRREADRIVRRLVSYYKDDLDKRPIGKPFPEVYDLVTLKPKPEWQSIYEQVKDELREMGLGI